MLNQNNQLIISYKDSLGKDFVINGNGMAVIDVFDVYEEGLCENYRKSGEWKGETQRNKFTFTELYKDGLLISGISKDNVGTEYSYKNIYVAPNYPEGINELRKFIGNNYQYPKEAIKRNVSGTIKTSFVIEKNGELTDIKVIEDLGYGTGQEAINVLKKAKKWSPGLDRGIPVRVQFALPIRLGL